MSNIRRVLIPALGLFALFSFGLPGRATAQEFRIVTVVYRAGDANPVSRSLTLFRGGKVYDYVGSADEVVVFESSRNEFLILNARQGLVTTVEQEQIRQRLGHVRDETEQYAAELIQQSRPDARRQVELLSFQLAPKFDEHFDDKNGRLQLIGDRVSYTFTGRQLEDARLTQAYLGYADWVSRLNFLLHPTPLLPDVRVEANKALRRYDLFPLRVELQADFEEPLSLSAEHALEHGLKKSDRSMIHQWELLLKSPRVKHVTFREYQRLTLGASDRS
ncbi:hypothetical protein [Stratiformator vulcanicus]|uniref:DUF4412 domain-containing protein n=1 Tax=Stratiformator vulcanicus TaxID=2527980 RepID=A0A517R7D6_9PLAN|nr:hypothetical protein [Stratiformator vulcanicus]QDT39806.1 hypothetical protein Pan189_42170 [Stratiformator vulcanicus]